MLVLNIMVRDSISVGSGTFACIMTVTVSGARHGVTFCTAFHTMPSNSELSSVLTCYRGLNGLLKVPCPLTSHGTWDHNIRIFRPLKYEPQTEPVPELAPEIPSSLDVKDESAAHVPSSV